MNAAVEREVRRAVREAQAAGRREAFAALGEVLVKALVPALVGRVPPGAVVGHVESPPVTTADPLATLLKSLSPETAEERLHAESARLGLSGQLHFVKAYEAEEYERLLADVADLWELERLTKADRSHLVRKVIRNRLGHRQVVWVSPQEGEEPQRGASRGQADHEGREEGGQAKLTREQAVESRTLVAKAVQDPNSLNPEQLRDLGRHVNAITKEEAKGLPRVLGQKLSGDQMAVAQRLVDAVRAGRQKGRGVGDALERAGTKVSGQYGVWGQAVGGTGGKPEAKREEFPKRGVGPADVKGEDKPAEQVPAPADRPAPPAADAATPAGQESAQSPTIGVDNPTTGGNTTPVQPQSAGASQGGGVMNNESIYQPNDGGPNAGEMHRHYSGWLASSRPGEVRRMAAKDNLPAVEADMGTRGLVALRSVDGRTAQGGGVKVSLGDLTDGGRRAIPEVVKLTTADGGPVKDWEVQEVWGVPADMLDGLRGRRGERGSVRGRDVGHMDGSAGERNDWRGA